MEECKPLNNFDKAEYFYMKDRNYIKLNHKIIAKTRENGQYLFTKEDMRDTLLEGKNIVIPLVVDTEYWQPSYKDFLNDKDKIIINSPLNNIYELNRPGYWEHGRQGITSQFKGIYEEKGVILAHPDLLPVARELKKEIRHPVATSGFDAIDYLNQIGINCSLDRSDTIIKEFKGVKIPTCEFVTYAHFALAEMLMICHGLYRDDMEKIIMSNKSSRAEMQRRMRFVTETKYCQNDSVELPWRIRIEGILYRVKISIIDTFAIHGIASYKDFCEASSIKLEAKNKMDEYKTMMHIGYFEKPNDFDEYSLGDLNVYDALSNNSENFKKIWKSLEILEYFQPPRLTIGASVRDIFVAMVCKSFRLTPDINQNTELLEILAKNIDDSNDENLDKKLDFKQLKNALLDLVCKKGTSEYLKNFTNSTKSLNAKVQGGRCGNNRPNLVELSGIINDIDLNSCYGEGQRNQLYPFGTPLVDEFDSDSRINNYPTLRQWLKKRKHGTDNNYELVPGLWQARVSTKEIWNDGTVSYAKLKYPQDFIASWFDFKFKDISEMKTDSQLTDAPENQQIEVRTGQTKIFNYQIINGVITHDVIDWLLNVCSPQQRNDLLDNLYVHTAMYYPAYERVNSIDELLGRIKTHQGRNTSNSKQVKKGSRHTKITEECTAWYGVNMGEFIIDDLLAWRKIFPKKNVNGSKNPMNTLYKLCVNTLYGDMVSPFFAVSNVVVGNNITARARAACYYTEKGFYTVQSITDGGQFNLKTVIYPANNRRITSQSVVNLYRENDVTKKNLKLGIIGGYDDITMEWIEIDKKYFPELTLIKNGNIEKLTPYKNKDEIVIPAMQWVDKLAIQHLQNLFNVDVLQAETTVLKVKKGEDGKPVKTFLQRKGQFEFESKSFGSSRYFMVKIGFKEIFISKIIRFKAWNPYSIIICDFY